MISSRCFKSVSIGEFRQNCRLSASIRSIQSWPIQENRKRTLRPKILTMDSINQNIVKMEFVVRSPLLTRAAQIEKEIKQVCTILFVNLKK